MGAETKYYVEVETVQSEWRVSYGVTRRDALENVTLSFDEKASGVVVTPEELKGETDD
jgi:hypothetical protein